MKNKAIEFILQKEIVPVWLFIIIYGTVRIVLT